MLLFGSKRIPEIGRSIGKGIQEFKAGLREGSSSNEELPPPTQAEQRNVPPPRAAPPGGGGPKRPAQKPPTPGKAGRVAACLVAVLVACSNDSSGPDAPPALGTMRVHISGKVTHDSTWSAFGQFRDILAADTGELSLLGGQSLSLTVSRNLTLVFP